MTAPSVQIPTWHHPHFVSVTNGYFGTEYEFKPFTGHEPEPRLPADVREAFEKFYAQHRGTPAGQAANEAWSTALREVEAAHIMWQAARHKRALLAWLQKVAPIARAYQQARKQTLDTYESLHATPDGFWQAKLLTLVEQRAVTLDLARKLDDKTAPIAALRDELPERVWDALPPIGDLAKSSNIDLGGWQPDLYGAYERAYSDDACDFIITGPETRELERLFAEQDERITQVTRLFGGDR